MRQMRPQELAEWLQRPGADAPLLLDVREPWEVAVCAIPGSTAVPIGEIPTRIREFDAGRPVVCICHHGVRSLQVAGFLEHNGFTEVSNLAGGIDAWSREVDPSCPTY
jgi:rhodanese-related sulfurtransferase